MLGDGALDALVNNAGISPKGPGGARLNSLDTDIATWQAMFNTNFYAPLLMTRGFAAELAKARGAVVNLTSIAASRVHPFAGSAYATSKAALGALTREMAHDLAPLGVRVNAIAPGEIDTAILSPGTPQIVERDIPMHQARHDGGNRGPDPVPVLAARVLRHRCRDPDQRRPACLSRSFASSASARRTTASTRVVDHLDLDIERGEFLTLLGPSGSGKTTTLMMLAGFETPTEGEILLDGKPLSKLPPHRRDDRHGVPELRAVPAHDRGREHRVPAVGARDRQGRDRDDASKRALDMVQLAASARASPRSCRAASSSAWRWRARWSSSRKLVLMDEPLGALDKQLREHMQLELQAAAPRLGVTMVYVTHDQHEALTMSDRVAVFNDGRVQQLDRPERTLRAAGATRSSRASSARTTGSRPDQGVDGRSLHVRLAGDALVDGLARGAAASRARRSSCRCGRSACISAAPHLQSRRTAIVDCAAGLREADLPRRSRARAHRAAGQR